MAKTKPTVVAAKNANLRPALLASLSVLGFRKNIFIMEERLLAKERDDPQDFAVKLELIEFYRSKGRLEDAKGARQRLVELVPVAEEVWLEWISDEQSVEVCKKALKDFWYPQVVIEYLKLANANGESIFSELVSHVRNPDLWILQRTLTQDPELKLKLYEKQFAIPMRGLETAWQEYCSVSTSRHIEATYLRSFTEWQKQRTHWENMQRHIDEGTENGFTSIVEGYVAAAPAQYHYIYEEAVLGFNSLPDLWESYVYHTMDSKKASKPAIRQLLKRALRNVPSKADFWTMLMLVSEELNKSVEKTFNKALQAAYSDTTAYLDLWKAYADYARRSQQDWTAVYQEGIEWLRSYVPPLHLNLKLSLASQIDEATDLYEEIVKEKGDAYSLWRAYLNYAEKTGEVTQVRHIYRRAVEYVKDYTSEICKEWLRWEESVNSPGELLSARLKVYKRLKRKAETLPVKRQREETKKATKLEERYTAYVGGVDRSIKDNDLLEYFAQLASVRDCRIVRDLKGNSKGFAYVDCESAEDLDDFIAKYQGKDLQGSILHISKSKPPAKSGRDAYTVFLNNLPYTVTEDELRTLLNPYGHIAEVRIIRNANGMCRGYAYAEFESEESAAAAAKLGKTRLGGREIVVSGAKSTQPVDKNVIYVANLPYTATESALSALFTGSTSVRMPMDEKGSSKGFAFVDFTTPSAADGFLEGPQIVLEGRALVLKRSGKAKKSKLSNTDFAKFL
mmetsp:Transcript_619/g.1081  ORF Transcript_619/g.1081 Transcript_619/m.1081 type:complete len:735 (-) Transcript_619:802-3006(-)